MDKGQRPPSSGSTTEPGAGSIPKQKIPISYHIVKTGIKTLSRLDEDELISLNQSDPGVVVALQQAHEKLAEIEAAKKQIKVKGKKEKDTRNAADKEFTEEYSNMKLMVSSNRLSDLSKAVMGAIDLLPQEAFKITMQASKQGMILSARLTNS